MLERAQRFSKAKKRVKLWQFDPFYSVSALHLHALALWIVESR